MHALLKNGYAYICSSKKQEQFKRKTLQIQGRKKITIIIENKHTIGRNILYGGIYRGTSWMNRNVIFQ